MEKEFFNCGKEGGMSDFRRKEIPDKGGTGNKDDLEWDRSVKRGIEVRGLGSGGEKVNWGLVGWKLENIVVIGRTMVVR